MTLPHSSGDRGRSPLPAAAHAGPPQGARSAAGGQPPPLPYMPTALNECPKCFYPLDGLPEYGQCPDCGHAYGAATLNNFLIRLTKCPQCDYSLEGSASTGNCPECGFSYDDQSFMLEGIARGMSTMPIGRRFAWVFVGLVGTICGTAIQMAIEEGVDGIPQEAMIVGCIVLLVWAAVLIYLIFTGKKEARGMEPFLFTAGGFGSSSNLDPAGSGRIQLTHWRDVDAARLDRVGKTWRRLRIGKASPHTGRFTKIVFDAGVRCDDRQAALVQRAIDERIARARGDTPGSA